MYLQRKKNNGGMDRNGGKWEGEGAYDGDASRAGGGVMVHAGPPPTGMAPSPQFLLGKSHVSPTLDN